MNQKSTPRPKTASNIPRKRTPRTIRVDDNQKSLPAIIPEAFNLKNIDIVGKIDDMRALTKELSIMARQIEQWVNVVHTVSLAFKDSSVFKDVLRAISSIGSGEYQRSAEAPKKKEQATPQFPFPFFGGRDSDSEDREGENYSSNKHNNPLDNINLLEIINNPAFKEIMSKLFLQQKK